MADYRWTALVAARDDLVTAFRDSGVVTVQYVSAFPDQQSVAVWLGTATDEQRESLRGVPDVQARVHGILMEHGFREEDLAELMVVPQSQETVDRDHDGSWFYALR